MFDYTGVGAPSGIASAGSASPSLYFDKANGVIYTNSGQGWTPVLESVQDGLTAHAGGGQASGVPITSQNARFTVVGTAADSATLPTAIPGLIISVSNAAAANSMNVFPAVGGAINALATNAAFALAAGKNAIFIAFNTTQWHAVLSA
jgi:hypothetical protein